MPNKRATVLNWVIAPMVRLVDIPRIASAFLPDSRGMFSEEKSIMSLSALQFTVVPHDGDDIRVNRGDCIVRVPRRSFDDIAAYRELCINPDPLSGIAPIPILRDVRWADPHR